MAIRNPLLLPDQPQDDLLGTQTPGYVPTLNTGAGTQVDATPAPDTTTGVPLPDGGTPTIPPTARSVPADKLTTSPTTAPGETPGYVPTLNDTPETFDAQRNPYIPPAETQAGTATEGADATDVGERVTRSDFLPSDTQYHLTDDTGAGATTTTTHTLDGFDTTKLNDPTYESSKYTKALRQFTASINGKPPTTDSLNALVAEAKANGFPNAKVSGKDTIDYGDGNGPIDVIIDVGGPNAKWAFQNTTGNAQWEAAHPDGAGAEAGAGGAGLTSIQALLDKLMGGDGVHLGTGGTDGLTAGTKAQDLIKAILSGSDSSEIDAALKKLMAGDHGTLSTATDDALKKLIASGGHNANSDATLAALKKIIDAQGGTDLSGDVLKQLDTILQTGGTDPEARRLRLVAARDSEATANRGMLADARGALASRGLSSQPGVGQGAEGTAISRVSESLAPSYANAVRDIETSDMDRQDANRLAALGLKTGVANAQGDRLLTATGQEQGILRGDTDALIAAISTATGKSAADARLILDSANAGTGRQTALAGVALQSLAQDQDWAKFLAQFGLNHDTIQEQLSQGRISQVIALLGLYLQSAQGAAAGYV